MPDRSPDHTIPCFACGALQITYPADPAVSPTPSHTIGALHSSALFFRATGNYGSTLFDPPGGEVLQIVICDRCVASRFDRVDHLVHLDEVPGWRGDVRERLREHVQRVGK